MAHTGFGVLPVLLLDQLIVGPLVEAGQRHVLQDDVGVDVQRLGFAVDRFGGVPPYMDVGAAVDLSDRHHRVDSARHTADAQRVCPLREVEDHVGAVAVEVVGVSFFRTLQNLGRRYGRAIRGRKVDPGASIPANGAKRSRGQDVVGGLRGKPVMSEKSAISQTTIAGSAGLAPSPSMREPEATAPDPRGRKALNARFATDQVHGSAGGSRRR
jgi:hypothetical protein